MIESEGITENVNTWRTDVVSQIMKDLPQEKVMFEGTFAQIVRSHRPCYIQFKLPHLLVPIPSFLIRLRVVKILKIKLKTNPLFSFPNVSLSPCNSRRPCSL
jgi:hypothetical protein